MWPRCRVRALPNSSRRWRTPPGSSPAAIGLAEPDELPTWFRRMLLRLSAQVRRMRVALRCQQFHLER